MKQINFSFESQNYKFYGGSLINGKRKTRRPLDSRKPLHLILKATNSFSLLRNKQKVESVTYKTSQKFGVKIHSMAVHFDHIHLNVSFANRPIYVMWIRAVSGTLAKKIIDLKFKLLPFSRIVSWGRDFKTVQRYIHKNAIEGLFLLRVNEMAEQVAKKTRHNIRYYSGAALTI